MYSTLPLLWTFICFGALAVWGGVAADSLYYWQRLSEENQRLGSAYFRELVADLAAVGLLAAWAIIGILAIYDPPGFDVEDILIIVGLFSGPVVLLGLGVYRFWRRTRQR